MIYYSVSSFTVCTFTMSANILLALNAETTFELEFFSQQQFNRCFDKYILNFTKVTGSKSLINSLKFITIKI